MTHPRTSKLSAFTLLELLIVLVVIVIVAALFLPYRRPSRQKAARIQCVNQLKNIGLGLRIFSTDNNGSLPWQVSTTNGGAMEHLANPNLAWAHFHALSNELSTPSILICPLDRGVLQGKTWATTRTNRALSYFLGMQAKEGQPSSILAGDSNLELNGRPLQTEIVLVRTNNTLRFDNTRHDASGNILLGDGSVQQVTSSRFRELVVEASRSGFTNRWLIP
jgi:prepilin-type N-terminal cleavage/methylation domain-containing protein